MKEMCSKAGLSGNFTNHSGKVTCATRLFERNVDEQLIMRQTGHRSNAVRLYKRPSSDHVRMVSSILQAPSPEKGEEGEKENCDPISSNLEENENCDQIDSSASKRIREDSSTKDTSNSQDCSHIKNKSNVQLTFNFSF
jgi:hypothetical protein